jgi:hypothetical protein
MIKSVYPVWQHDLEDYKKRRNAIEIRNAQIKSSKIVKSVSINLAINNDDNIDVTENSKSHEIIKPTKRRRTPRELMNEMEKENN